MSWGAIWVLNYPHFLDFQEDQLCLKQNPRTLDIVKNMRRGQNATSVDRFGKSLNDYLEALRVKIRSFPSRNV